MFEWSENVVSLLIDTIGWFSGSNWLDELKEPDSEKYKHTANELSAGVWKTYIKHNFVSTSKTFKNNE